VGNKSAALGHYFAAPGNKFWRVLHEVGFTPHQLRPADYASAIEHHFGLTDLAKHAHGMDKDLGDGALDPDGARERIRAVSPGALAFNGKKAAETFLGRRVEYGLQQETLGATTIWVLPSTSGAAGGSWNIEIWRDLHAAVSGRTPRAPAGAVAKPRKSAPAKRRSPDTRVLDLPPALQHVRDIALVDPIIETLTYSKQWTIKNVSHRCVTLTGGKAGSTKKVEAAMIIAAWQRLEERGRLTRDEVQRDLGRPNYRRSSLLFALLARFPGVRLDVDAGGKVLRHSR
jgi:double-stranded uracil-DNA glycosylase